MTIHEQILIIIHGRMKLWGWTQAQLAEAMTERWPDGPRPYRTTQQAVGRLLAADGNPTMRNMQRITDALGITIQCTEAGLVARDKGE